MKFNLKNYSASSLALPAALLSGMAALSYEVLWTRRLTDLTGGDAASITRVIGCFFLGLALGAAAMALVKKSFPRPWRTLAIVEILIAALSIPILTLPIWGHWIWLSLGPEFLISNSGEILKLILSASLVLIPSFFMGTSLPLMVAGIMNTPHSKISPIHVYAINTIGGAGGIALVLLLTLKWLGVSGAQVVTMALNLMVAGIAWFIDGLPEDKHSKPKSVNKNTDKANRIEGFSFSLCMVLSFLSGFLILGFEIATIEMLMLVAPMSMYAPAVVLFCFIACLGFCAFLVAVKAAWFRNVKLLLPGVLTLAGMSIVLSPGIFMSYTITAGGVPPAPSFAIFLLNITKLALVSCGAALFFLGFTFPLILRNLEKKPEASSKSRSEIAALLAINGLGGLVGAEMMFRFLLPELGIYISVGAVGGLSVISGMAITLWIPSDNRFNKLAFSTGIAILSLLIGVFKLPQLDTINPHMGLKILDQSFGREGTLAVVEHKEEGRSLLVANQYLLGSVGARSTQERQAHIPLLLHPKPVDVAFIGIATGITPGAALLHSAVETITAMEISESVVKASKNYFAEYNHEFMTSPRTRIVQEDGRIYLAACKQCFDVVIGDLFLPWGSGVGKLYSLEHFTSVANSLKADGLFCQWLPMYQFTPEQFRLVQNTFVRVFPDSLLFCNSFQSSNPAVALIGWNGNGYSAETILARCQEELLAGALKDPLSRHSDGLSLLNLGPADKYDPLIGVNTLDNMLLELSAAQTRVAGNPGSVYYYGSRWTAFVETRVAHPQTNLIPDHTVSIIQAFQKAEKLKNSASLKRTIVELLPESILQDDNADWNLWEGPKPEFKP